MAGIDAKEDTVKDLQDLVHAEDKTPEDMGNMTTKTGSETPVIDRRLIVHGNGNSGEGR